ncbi:MAG: four helix bundle protein [Patescibacteria group bacterium]
MIAAYKLWHIWLKNFPKTSRYTIGEKLDGLFIKILELFFIASGSPKDKKLPLIKTAIENLDLLKFFLRLSWEMKLLDTNKYQILSVKLEEVGRLSWKWKISIEKTLPL